jgi:hypothetical protein
MALVGLVLASVLGVLVESPTWLLQQYPQNEQRRYEAIHNLRKLRLGDGNGDTTTTNNDDTEITSEVEMILQEMQGRHTPGGSDTIHTPAAISSTHHVEEETDASEQLAYSDQRLPEFTMATHDNMDTYNDPDEYEDENVHNETENQAFSTYLQDSRNRIPIISSILFPIAQQLSGINAVFYYSTAIFETAGGISNPQNGTILAFVVNVVATMVALCFMERWGRKTLLSLSAGGMWICCILLTISFVKGGNNNNDDDDATDGGGGVGTVLIVLLYITFFELGLGCIPFFLATEMIPSQFSGRIQSISMTCNWLSNFCVGLFFPYLDQWLGPYSFVPFAVILLGVVGYAVWILPESRGRTPSQVLQELDRAQHGRHGRSPSGHEPLPLDDDIFVDDDTDEEDGPVVSGTTTTGRNLV